VTTVEARTGRKLNNALTLTFKTPEQTVALGTQVGSAWVLLGFKNGAASGRFTLKGNGGLALDCRARRTTVTTDAGEPVGTITRENDDGIVRDGTGSITARIEGLPQEKARDPTCPYPLFDEAGAPFGTLTLITTAAQPTDLLHDLTEMAILWDKPASLKVPTLGTRLQLAHPVDGALGDLLLSTCITIALGPQAFIRH